MLQEEKKTEGQPEKQAKKENKLKKRAERIWQRNRVLLGQMFYDLGTEAEYLAVRFCRQLVRAARFVGGVLAGWLGRRAAQLKRLGNAVWQDVSEPFVRLGSGVQHMRTMAEEDKAQGGQDTGKKVLEYLKSGVKRYGYLARNLAGYLLPLAAAAVFAVTVAQTLGGGYALAVEYDGQLVGYVESAAISENAEKMVADRIVYTGNEEGSWNMTPTFTVVSAGECTLSDTQTLADAILESSGAEITEAVGLYVNGTFYGATTDSLQLESDLEAIKRPYEELHPEAEVDFVQDVVLQQGIYLSSSLEDYDKLAALLTSEVEAQRTYVVQQGDTPLKIAGAHGITTSDLYALNPVLQNGKVMPVGQELTISGAQSFLQVQYSLTTVEEEEVAYAVDKSYDNSLAYGSVKTVQAGVKGADQVTYVNTYVDGVRVSRVETERVRLREPVTQKVIIGTKTVAGNFMPGNGVLMFPIDYGGYKYMSRGFTGVWAHNGQDLCGYVGTPIYAAQSGVVTIAKYTNRGYGIYCRINHGGGLETLYGHCNGLAVSVGQYVQKGQLIAYLGNTGNSTGPHCHFEVIVNGTRVNPANYLG